MIPEGNPKSNYAYSMVMCLSDKFPINIPTHEAKPKLNEVSNI